MAYSELPWRPFLGHQAGSWTTLRRGNVFLLRLQTFFFKFLSRFFTFLTFFIVNCTFFSGAIWDVPKHELIFWRGHKNCSGGGPGVFTVYLIPYTDRCIDRYTAFNFRGPFGGHSWRPKIKIKIRAYFVVLPKNPQHNNILNIAWTSKQLNLKLKKFWTGAQKFAAAQKLLRGHDASASLRHPRMAPGFLHQW